MSNSIEELGSQTVRSARTAWRGVAASAGAAVLLACTALPPTALATETGVLPAEADESAAVGEHGPLREGQIVTVAGTGEAGYSGDGHDAQDARIKESSRISVGPDGAVYIAGDDNKRVRVVSPDGVIDTVPGTSFQRTSATDGPGSVVKASAVGPDGSLYLAATDGIRRVDESGEHHIIGGNGEEDFHDGADGGDGGPATEAWINAPQDIAVADDGSVYVADRSNKRVRKIDPDGTITTVAGGGELDTGENEGGPATESRLSDPKSVAVDSAGTVYVADGISPTGSSNDSVSEVAPDGTISTLVGLNEPGYAGDGGPVEDAQLGERIGGLAVDAEDNLHIADIGYEAVRQVDGDGVISMVGFGFDSVDDIAFGPDGNLHLVDGAEVKMLVRDAEPSDDEDEHREGADESPWSDRDPGDIATVAGVDRGPDAENEETDASAADPGQPDLMDAGAKPADVAVGPDGTIYYSAEDRHQVGAVAPDGTVDVIAGTGEPGLSGDGGPATEAELKFPGGLAVDDEGVVYVAENGRVRMIDEQGTISTVEGTGPANEEFFLEDDSASAATSAAMRAADVAIGPDGSLFIADSERGAIRKVDPDGASVTVVSREDLWAEGAELTELTEAWRLGPDSVAVDDGGNVYFTWSGMPSVHMMSPDGVLTAIVGDTDHDVDEGGFSGDGGPAEDAELNAPIDVTIGPDGDVYVADRYNARVRRIGAEGNIDTIAGTGERRDAGDGGPAAEAPIHEPSSVAFGPDGSLYLTSPDGSKVRTVDADGTITTVTELSGRVDSQDREDGDNVELTATDVAVGPGGSVYVADRDLASLWVHPDGSIAKLGDGIGADVVAEAGDGSAYVAAAGGVVRAYPDGVQVFVAGGGSRKTPPDDGDMATTYTYDSRGLAVDPDGVLHMLMEETVYRLEQDGTLTVVAELGEEVSSTDRFAVDGDGRVYLGDQSENRVVRIESDGAVTTVAGNGETDDVRDGDGGDATDATVKMPKDVAVAADGTLYIADSAGVRRVDSEGTITTLFDSHDNEDGSIPRALALDANGDVYFVDTSTEQVRVIVQADEAPNPNAFPWSAAAAVGLPLLAVGAVVCVWRRRQLAELIRQLRHRAWSRRGRVQADQVG